MIDGDLVMLKNQFVYDYCSYDVCKDVICMEVYVNCMGFSVGVLVLLNDLNYWQEWFYDNSVYKVFCLFYVCELGGELLWGVIVGEGMIEVW